MTKRNLITALAAALENNPNPGRTPDARETLVPPNDDILLNALRNSATGCDQIMQRRLGALLDKPIT